MSLGWIDLRKDNGEYVVRKLIYYNKEKKSGEEWN